MNRFLFSLIFTLLFFLNLYSYQNINIAAIRVEFQVEVDDNDLTTGDGTFMDSVTTDPFAIDRTPHNRTYFNDQIIAADNYFNSVSNGNVRITGDVFPKSMDGAYQLSHEMSFYNPNTTQAEIDKGIGKLFIDAVTIADSDPDFNFSDYDLVVVFHAGVGRDIDLGFDETPQDIPSLFVTSNFLKENNDSSFAGIPVDGGTMVINQGIILPETENQQGVQVALTGLFVSNIGTYLGLFDLFSASEQRSGVGRFGLMDVGLFNISGLIPAPPSAFSRKLLGWESPETLVSNGDNIQIAKFQSDAAGAIPSMIEIPVNEDESYLLEYRNNMNSNIDSLQFELSKDRDEFAGHLEVLKTFFADELEISDSSGVVLSVSNYDLGLPGSGVLIWHIDQSVIRANEGKTINDNPDWRAVDLEEADGIQDIGESYDFLDAGFQSELGTRFDYWFHGNDAPLFKNRFSTDTRPNSLSNLNRAQTGITISNFSSNKADIMTFNFSRQLVEPGFPVVFNSENTGNTYTLSAVPENKTTAYVFTISESGAINAVGLDGNGLLYPGKNLLAQVEVNTSGVQSIALADTNDNGNPELLIAMSGGTLYGFDLTTVEDSLAKQIFSTIENITASVNSPIVVSDKQIFYVDGNFINRYSIKGGFQDSESISHSTKDLILENDTAIKSTLDFDYIGAVNNEEIILASIDESTSSENTEFTVLSLLDEIKYSFSAEKLVGQFSIAFLGNGPDILYNTEKEIVARNINGTYLLNFPIAPNLLEDEFLVGTPMVIDITGESDEIIIVTSNKGQILAYDEKGDLVDGFPFAARGSFSEAAIIAQIDNDEAWEIVAVSNSGTVTSWEISGSSNSSEIEWAMANFNSSNNVNLTRSYVNTPTSKNLLPKARFFNYPNPNEGDETTIRYYLNETAEVNIRIFDAAGYKVDEFSGTGLAFTDNEVKWNVGNIASGVYICQLEAVSEKKTERRLIKILVVH